MAHCKELLAHYAKHLLGPWESLTKADSEQAGALDCAPAPAKETPVRAL